MTIKTANLGFPRIGSRRELKFALENYWSGKHDKAVLEALAAKLRADNWRLQADKGIAIIPSNDFSLYDQVLDTAVMVGAIPKPYGWTGGPVDLDTYFAMARGSTGDGQADCGHSHQSHGVAALEMTKWFDTNYHYMVPEFDAEQEFALTVNTPVEAFLEAKALGIHTRPVILGPITFLRLGKSAAGNFSTLDLLPKLLPVYAQILADLRIAGADWVQIDEPCFILDLSDKEREAVTHAYTALTRIMPSIKIMLATYFGDIGDNMSTVLDLPVAGLHVDLVRGPQQVAALIEKAPAGLVLSLGLVDGRNVWRTDLSAIMRKVQPLIEAHGSDNIQFAPSCSLLHVPVDVELETALDPELGSWLAFAVQKLEELVDLGAGFDLGKRDAVLAKSAGIQNARLTSVKVHDPIVAGRLKEFDGETANRQSPFPQRRLVQSKKLDLPLFPTTTIGSFPQTPDVRKARSAHVKGGMSYLDYHAFLQRETETAIRWQEEIDLDVLVHGEFERNDMVQYFGEQLSGFAFTQHAWVQSYGSRYVRPPIIYGDVSRPNPMTVDWWTYSQSLTKRPVKGMLTGPVTILNWSFVRDDLPRSTVCRQIALAIRDEVQDLEQAGAVMIQIDEAALREGLPLRRADWQHYLDWAIECFRICSTGVADDTQIHTHMCYSEFNDIMPAIAAMDADVISIETSRSKMELLRAFADQQYPNEIGPGVYDIHSPRVPDVDEMVDLIDKALAHLDPTQIWINPDCGLKTRKWDEVKPALINMVSAAATLRSRYLDRPKQRATP